MPTYPNGLQLLMLATEMSIVVHRVLTRLDQNRMPLGVQKLWIELDEEEQERQRFLSRLLRQAGTRPRSLFPTAGNPLCPTQRPLPCPLGLPPENPLHGIPVGVSKEELLRMVIGLYVEQAAFFSKLQPAVKDVADRRVLEAIIEDQEESIVWLQARLAALPGCDREQDDSGYLARTGGMAITGARRRRYGATSRLYPPEDPT